MRARSRVRASSEDLDEVDPVTGQIIAGTARSKVASESIVTPNDIRIAYRRADVPENATKTVVCLHGLGSSSYSFRNSLPLLAAAGLEALAVDWPGHGDSDHPDVSKFDYTIDAYIDELDNILKGLPVDNRPVNLVVHGYVLGQAAILYAATHPDVVDKVVALNVPFGKKVKLRPELAAYKSPLGFMKPKLGAAFKGDLYAAAGSPYALSRDDADAYNRPYEQSQASSDAIYHTMEALDFEALKARVSDALRDSFRNPMLIIHGSSDSFIDLKTTLDFLEDQRTNIKLAYGIEAKLGHCPQEDYPAAINDTMTQFLLN
jgi:pimeloyl-ACP methyl ester carboxylesterase